MIAVTELLTNAIKFGNRDTIVALSYRRHGTRIQIAVSNLGAGITHAEQRRVFDRFYRTPTQDLARSKASGSGSQTFAPSSQPTTYTSTSTALPAASPHSPWICPSSNPTQDRQLHLLQLLRANEDNRFAVTTATRPLGFRSIRSSTPDVRLTLPSQPSGSLGRMQTVQPPPLPPAARSHHNNMRVRRTARFLLAALSIVGFSLGTTSAANANDQQPRQAATAVEYNLGASAFSVPDLVDSDGLPSPMELQARVHLPPQRNGGASPCRPARPRLLANLR